jgi:hypothetical protein
MTNCILCLFCLFSSAATAAEKFLLYHVTNEVHWTHDGKKENARRGVFIKEKESITVKTRGDVMLIRNDGKSLLLDQPGVYTFQKLKELFQSNRSKNASSRFFAYVFEKFLSNGENEEQKITAVVYRGKRAMLAPADSGFVFSKTIRLNWKPEQVNIPYKISITINGVLFDTLIRKQTFLSLPQHLLQKTNEPILITWTCYPYDSKQTKPPPFLLLLSSAADQTIIQQQLKQLRSSFAKRQRLLKTMENDLFARWLELYQFAAK